MAYSTQSDMIDQVEYMAAGARAAYAALPVSEGDAPEDTTAAFYAAMSALLVLRNLTTRDQARASQSILTAELGDILASAARR